MRVLIDYDLCEGNGICAQLVPEVFRVDDAGNLHLLDESPADAIADRLRSAVRSCPRGAIAVDGLEPSQ